MPSTRALSAASPPGLRGARAGGGARGGERRSEGSREETHVMSAACEEEPQRSRWCWRLFRPTTGRGGTQEGWVGPWVGVGG